MTDSKAVVRDALRAAGIAEAALTTAEAEFKPTRAGTGPNGQEDWNHNGSTTTLRKHAQRYAEGHPFLCEEGNAPSHNPADKYWPRYADGTLVPADKVDADTMFDVQTQNDADKAREERGPEPDYSEQIAEGRSKAREAMMRDAAEAHRAEQVKRHGATGGDGHKTANLPPGVSSEFRNHYSDEPTADELFDVAGDGSDLPGYWQGGDSKDRR
jgi:hypothetical protein